MYYNYRIDNRAYEEPAAILFISATRKDCIPPPPVGLSWDSPHPPPESVRTDGRMDGRTYAVVRTKILRINGFTKFAYPWCSASSAITVFQEKSNMYHISEPKINRFFPKTCATSFTSVRTSFTLIHSALERNAAHLASFWRLFRSVMQPILVFFYLLLIFSFCLDYQL